MAAHEIRNPLATIRGLLELYRERAGEKLPDEGRQTVKDVLAEVERLRGVTGDLLDLSSERALSTSPHSLEALVREAAAGHPSLKVVVPASETLAEVDSLRLGQVLTNLLRNAGQAR